jgi:ribosome maturation factor RimP
LAEDVTQSAKQGVSARIESAVAPLLAAEGYELWTTEFVGRAGILRLYIDREGGVGIDDCTSVSHLVSDYLDAEGVSDTIEGAFTLEVSSPGLDRLLVRPEHFTRYVGATVKVSTRQPVDGQRRFQGALVEASEQAIIVEHDGADHTITYDLIDKARLVPQW